MHLSVDEASSNRPVAPQPFRNSSFPAKTDALRVLIVSEHASAQFGGEAALPLHYFRTLRERGMAVWLVTHDRTRDELTRLFPDETRIHYVKDTELHRAMYRIGGKMPDRIGYVTVGFVSRFATQLTQRRMVRRLIRAERIDIVHQPMPVSPREPSMMFGLGAPVVIGPMNGGMDYPPAFRRQRSAGEQWLYAAARNSAAVLNRIMPGKRKAAALLVANQRTRKALPAGVCRNVIEMAENGVDMALWQPPARDASDPSAQMTKFVFLGRLVGWKAVDMLLEAFQRATGEAPMSLTIIGDGNERGALERSAVAMGIHVAGDHPELGEVAFCGWLAQTECAGRLKAADCLVLPSLLECGGAVVLEAMALAKPVIATAWGGPLDYLDSSCGVLVPPTDRAGLISGLADAMVRMARSPAERHDMGLAGRRKVEREYDWAVKTDRILGIYASAAMAHQANAVATGGF